MTFDFAGWPEVARRTVDAERAREAESPPVRRGEDYLARLAPDRRTAVRQADQLRAAHYDLWQVTVPIARDAVEEHNLELAKRVLLGNADAAGAMLAYATLVAAAGFALPFPRSTITACTLDNDLAYALAEIGITADSLRHPSPAGRGRHVIPGTGDRADVRKYNYALRFDTFDGAGQGEE